MLGRLEDMEVLLVYGVVLDGFPYIYIKHHILLQWDVHVIHMPRMRCWALFLCGDIREEVEVLPRMAGNNVLQWFPVIRKDRPLVRDLNTRSRDMECTEKFSSERSLVHAS